MKGIYYIENTINEFGSIITGYFSTIKEAKEVLKQCSDWFKPKGTGRIYFQEFGLNKPSKLVYEK